jgi:hypothetical protein
MQSIKLNLIPGSVLPVVNVSQYDAHRQFQLVVYEGATAYSLTGKTVEIRGTKPDGNGFAYDAQDGVVTVSNNVVTISTTQQMTAVGGQTMAELRITSGDTILGTLNFILMVEPSALSDDTPISETEIPVIERDFEAALEEAQEAAATATTKAGEAATSATSAAGSATSAAGSATTASNAATTATTKAGEASTSATNAGNSATAAAADSLEAEGWAVGEQGGTPVGPTSPYYQNNAAYYAAQAGQYATGGLIFKGSVAFANIPTTGMVNGDMYNITDDFTTDSRFIEGAGVAVKAGADIAYVAGSVNKWDILALGGGGGADALDDLTDVSITSAADGDLLQRDGNGKWVNSAKIPQKVAGLQETGCVNILPNDAISQVVSGVTIVKNSDKSLSISTDANGTTADVNITIHTVAASEFETLSGKQWKLVGCPTGGSFSTYFLAFARYNDGGSGAYDVGSGAIFTFTRTATSPAPYVLLTIKAGAVLTTPIVVKPMLTPDLSATYDDYVPYSMTNRELTEAMSVVETATFSVPDEYHVSGKAATIVFQKIGKLCIARWTGALPEFPSQNVEYSIGNIPTGFVPVGNTIVQSVDAATFNKGMYMELTKTGIIHIFGYSTGTAGKVTAQPQLVYFTN